MLTVYRIGRGGRWTRARQKPATFIGPRRGDSASGRRSPSPRSPTKTMTRHGDRLRFGVLLFSAAMLLVILAYAEVRSGSGLVELKTPGIGVATD